MNVVLIGYRGSGKSTVGRLLAERLGWSFVDTDGLIETRCGKTIREIFAELAEDGFRDMERTVVKEVAAMDRCVISTGGGVVLCPENTAALKESGMLVYLSAPADVLWERIFNDAHRHKTRVKMNPSTGLHDVREALSHREPIYTAAADRVVEVADQTIESIVDGIMTRCNLRDELKDT